MPRYAEIRAINGLSVDISWLSCSICGVGTAQGLAGSLKQSIVRHFRVSDEQTPVTQSAPTLANLILTAQGLAAVSHGCYQCMRIY